MYTGYTKAHPEARRLRYSILNKPRCCDYNGDMCYFCGDAVFLDNSPGFGETCPTCGKDMHVCLMCSFYAPQARWACRETVDSQVLEKDKRNFCDYFRISPEFRNKTSGDPKGRNKAEVAKSAFDALFKTS